MKIAMITPYPIYPAIGGNRVRLNSLTNELRAEGHDVYCILLSSHNMGEYEHDAHVQKFGDRFIKLDRNPIENAIYLAGRFLKEAKRRLRRRSLHSNGAFDSVDEIYFPGFDRQLSALVCDAAFDVAIVHYVTMSKAFDAFPKSVRKILDTHDSFEGTIPSSELRRGLLRSDIVYATQNQEAQYFSDVLGQSHVLVRVQAHSMSDLRQLDLARTEGATFVGSSFEANEKSITYFIESVLPLVTQKAPDFKLFVAGSICNNVEYHPSIVKLGRVEHVADAYLRGPILINPITAGTGLKIKLLEAMSLGIPAVSTAMGVRGIDEIFLSGALVIPDGDAQAFADALVRLMSDTALRMELGAKATGSAELWNSSQRNALRSTLSEPIGLIGAA